MNKEVFLVVEGLTEQLFVERVLAPYCAEQGVYLHPTQAPKKGQRGGDIRFARVKICVGNFLKQRTDTYVGTFFDYYGLKEWPSLGEVRAMHGLSSADMAKKLNDSATMKLCTEFPRLNVPNRFIPFLAVHEFEALLFSDASLLASSLGINASIVNETLRVFGSPEAINTHPDKIPSRHIEKWTNGHYVKTVQGVAIAEKIGIAKMRAACPNFNDWLNRLSCNQRVPAT